MEQFALPSIGLSIEPEAARFILEWAVSNEPRFPPDLLKRMGLVHCMVNRGYSCFVETGTYLGDTTDAIAALLKCRVFTIELDDELHRRACMRFAGNDRITCLHGDSATQLDTILQGLDQPALFWLDSHYAGEGTAHGDSVSPILAELECLRRARETRPYLIDACSIYIDDMRLFGVGDYPPLADLLRVVERDFPRHLRTIHNDAMRIVPKPSE